MGFLWACNQMDRYKYKVLPSCLSEKQMHGCLELTRVNLAQQVTAVVAKSGFGSIIIIMPHISKINPIISCGTSTQPLKTLGLQMFQVENTPPKCPVQSWGHSAQFFTAGLTNLNVIAGVCVRTNCAEAISTSLLLLGSTSCELFVAALFSSARLIPASYLHMILSTLNHMLLNIILFSFLTFVLSFHDRLS